MPHKDNIEKIKKNLKDGKKLNALKLLTKLKLTTFVAVNNENIKLSVKI